MKQRLADYVADFLVAHDITDCFTVVGGGAMYLNDALGHKDGLHCTYNHHEQASAIAAEAYARLNNKIAVLCVTITSPKLEFDKDLDNMTPYLPEEEKTLLSYINMGGCYRLRYNNFCVTSYQEVA